MYFGRSRFLFQIHHHQPGVALGFFSFGGLLVTDFKETEMRKKCRHCRMRLPAPTSNEREAFCTRGCYNSFYLHRCLVCEDKIERTTANRKICKKSKCRNALAAGQGFGRYHADSGKTTHVSKNLEPAARNPYFMRVGKRFRHCRAR
jgi:hypothetical protein